AEERGALRRLCQERQLCLIADEVFGDYRLGPPSPDRAETLVDEDGALCFVLSGLSKVLGLPQLKLGWIHVGGPEALRRPAQERGALRRLCQERQLCLIADEVFGDYRLGPPSPDRAETLVDEDGALCFVLSGLSKVLGLPQLKLGWIHVGGPEALRRPAQE